MTESDRQTFFIGELAERTGLSRDAIRYYESAGISPPAERSESTPRSRESPAVP